jgi:hypothetical protein
MVYVEGPIDKVFAAFGKKEVHGAWFQWLEWATVSAAVYALGRQAGVHSAASSGILALGWMGGSVLLIAAAIISETMLVLRAYQAIEAFVISTFATGSHKMHPIRDRVITIALGLVPLAITFFLMTAFHAALQ